MPNATSREQATHATADALAAWLLGEAVVLRGGARDGLVVNWRDDGGEWNAGYPEIAGYYLQFLCRLDAPPRRGAAAANAARVAGWLERIGRDGPPLTRYLRRPAADEWRNGALFSFDLAMIVRGLALADERFPGAVPAGLTARYAGWLAAIENAGLLASHRLLAGAEALPEKWSTTPGFHHVKAAACLAYRDDPAARTLALATAMHWAGRFEAVGRALFGDLHPFLYFIEGLLVLWARDGTGVFLDVAEQAFDLVLDEVERCGGTAPGHQGGPPASARADVLAQVLRAGTVLQAAGRLAPARWQPCRADLLAALADHVAPGGGVLFSAAGGHRNVWATIFAWQALALDARAATDPAATLAEALI